MVDPLLLPSQPRRTGQELYLVGRPDHRRRSVRARLLRDLAARGGADGPPAAAAARACLACARRCRHTAEQKMRAAPRGFISAPRRPIIPICRLGDPAGADSYFMTGSTLSILANRISYVFDSARAEPRRRYRLLVVARRSASCLRGDSRPQDRQRDRRRRQPAARALSVHRVLPRLDAVAARPLLCFRRASRRLCPRRGRRGRCF